MRICCNRYHLMLNINEINHVVTQIWRNRQVCAPAQPLRYPACFVDHFRRRLQSELQRTPQQIHQCEIRPSPQHIESTIYLHDASRVFITLTVLDLILIKKLTFNLSQTDYAIGRILITLYTKYQVKALINRTWTDATRRSM